MAWGTTDATPFEALDAFRFCSRDQLSFLKLNQGFPVWQNALCPMRFSGFPNAFRWVGALSGRFPTGPVIILFSVVGAIPSVFQQQEPVFQPECRKPYHQHDVPLRATNVHTWGCAGWSYRPDNPTEFHHPCVRRLHSGKCGWYWKRECRSDRHRPELFVPDCATTSVHDR